MENLPFKPTPQAGHPKTQAMQTADRAPVDRCRPCRPNTFFLTLDSLFSVLQLQNGVKYVLMFVIYQQDAQTRHLTAFKLAHILGANCVNFLRVCSFNSFVQFVSVVVLFIFSISLVSNLLTDSRNKARMVNSG